jgi:ABC-type Fe3+ transport system permease subunit
MNPAILAAACSGKGVVDQLFLSFPTWYEYLPTTSVNGVCSPQLSSLSDVWLIVAAVIEILLRIAALVAVAFVIYGGIAYSVSQGNPDKTSKAKNTLLYAFIGLVIAVSAAAIVTFIAGSIN